MQISLQSKIYLVALACAFFSSTSHSDLNIFSSIKPEKIKSSSQLRSNGAITSHHLVDINLKALLKVSHSQHLRFHQSEASFNVSDGAEMQLPDGRYIFLFPTRLQSHMKGVNTYTGFIEEPGTGWFALTVDKKKVFGEVHYENMVYEIEYSKRKKAM